MRAIPDKSRPIRVLILILQQVQQDTLLPWEQPVPAAVPILGTTIPACGAKRPQAEESPAEFVPQPGFSISGERYRQQQSG